MKNILGMVCFLGLSLGLAAQQTDRPQRTEEPVLKKACCSKGQADAGCQKMDTKPACHQEGASNASSTGQQSLSAASKEKGRKRSKTAPAAAPKD